MPAQDNTHYQGNKTQPGEDDSPPGPGRMIMLFRFYQNLVLIFNFPQHQFLLKLQEVLLIIGTSILWF
jgi:hypothetical protein